eukprot:gene11505-9674_t
MDIPTDSPQEEKRGWCGDSLAAHRTLASFFDTRAAWIKWTEDMAYTSSNLRPAGTVPATVPCLLNISSKGDGYNVGEQGWPASSYGDWCPVNVGDQGSGCTSVSALLNSVYFILDVDAAVSLLRASKAAGGGGGGPSEAQL